MLHLYSIHKHMNFSCYFKCIKTLLCCFTHHSIALMYSIYACCFTHHRIALILCTMPESMNKFSGLAHDSVSSQSSVTKMTAPLWKLLKNGVYFRWDETHQAALDLIKNELCDAKILPYYSPDPEAKTILQCDAIHPVF